MGGAFDDIIEGSTADVEVAFKGANDFDSGQDNRTFPASVVSDLEALPEVESAHPQNTLQTVFVIGKDGKVIGGNGPPGLAINPTDAQSLTGKPILSLVRGSYPTGPDQIALDVDTAEKGDFKLGDKVELATPGRPPVMKTKLTGLVEFGSGGLNGATMTVFDTAFMQQRFYGGRDVFTTVSLNAAGRLPDASSRRRRRRSCRPAWSRAPATPTSRRTRPTSTRSSASCRPSCWSSPRSRLFVGIFIIINTFSILVAQRSRELALLRAMGASRRQVNRSVLLEAVVVGLVGSTVGLGVGYLLALGLRWLFGRVRAGPEPRRVPDDLAGRVLVLRHRDRASRPSPPSCRRGARHGSRRSRRCATTWPCPRRSVRRRVLIGTVLVLLGAGAMAAGTRGRRQLGLIGLGGRHPAHLRRRRHDERLPRPTGAAPVRGRLLPHCSARSAGWPPRTPCATRAVPARPRVR